MLKQLTLTNWKSFRHAKLPLDPLTVLIGTNASGKSNAIEALEFLKRVALGQDFKTALMGDSTISSLRGGIEWATYKSESCFELEVVVQGEESNTDYLYKLKLRTGSVHYEPLDIWHESLVCRNCNDTSPQEKPLFLTQETPDNKPGIFVAIHIQETERKFESFRRNVSILSQISYGLLPLDFPLEFLKIVRRLIEILQNIFILDAVPARMRDYSLLTDELSRDASNIAGVLATLSSEQKSQLDILVESYIKHLPEGDIQRVWAEKVGRFETDAMLYCEEVWKGDRTTEGSPNPRTLEIDARGMSDGTLRFLAILTALLTRPEGSQLVIEEVDNGLHPSRAELLLKMLREIGEQRKIDLLVTTHNPALLDALGPEMVPFVVVAHRDINGDSQLTLLEEVANLPKLMASGTLGKLTTKGAIERSLSHPR